MIPAGIVSTVSSKIQITGPSRAHTWDFANTTRRKGTAQEIATSMNEIAQQNLRECIMQNNHYSIYHFNT